MGGRSGERERQRQTDRQTDTGSQHTLTVAVGRGWGVRGANKQTNKQTTTFLRLMLKRGKTVTGRAGKSKIDETVQQKLFSTNTKNLFSAYPVTHRSKRRAVIQSDQKQPNKQTKNTSN